MELISIETSKNLKSKSRKYSIKKKINSIKKRAIIIITILSSIILILFLLIIFLIFNLISKNNDIKTLIKENNNLKNQLNIVTNDISLNINISNKSITPKINNINDNKNYTLKNQYYKRFEKVFSKYRKETELSNEYKNKLKKNILSEFSLMLESNYTYIDTIIFDKKMNLGNSISMINNLIYYCEILGCKNLYLSEEYWFIKKPIYDKELNINISPFHGDNFNKESTVHIEEQITFDKLMALFNDNSIPVRTYILKDEILSNVKLIDTKDEDLIINIRSGEDIFSNKFYSPESYHQPPLCFYQTIIENFNFTNIYIVANGQENPVINKLLKLYNNIKYMHGTVAEDMGMVLSAKNLVLANSSLTIELVKLSDNVQNVFFYDFIQKKDKSFYHFRESHLRPLKYNIFIMYPTKEYSTIMYPWQRKEEQFKQMINEKCNKKFKIIPSDFS